jgi:hypothetical protein
MIVRAGVKLEYGGLDGAEIAELLGVSEITVKRDGKVASMPPLAIRPVIS